jgi:hydroxypyruvate isomerase
MPRLAANLAMMFNEVSFMDRFARAATSEFKAVEILFPYEWSPDELASQLDKNNLQLALFNMPPGNEQAGEKGLASLPGREGEFENGLEAVLNYANALDCRQVHMMAGIPGENISPQLAGDTFVNNLKKAARVCHDNNIKVLIEPINLYDMPGYFLNTQSQAIDLIARADEPNIALQMDFYHCQITEGNLTRHLRDNIKQIAHIQIAGPPDRHEPDTGEINYPYLFNLIDDLGYQGWIGCEYRPAGNTEAGLGWAAPYLFEV